MLLDTAQGRCSARVLPGRKRLTMPAPARRRARIEAVRARAYTIPTDQPEADGTFALGRDDAGGRRGRGRRRDRARLHLQRGGDGALIDASSLADGRRRARRAGPAARMARRMQRAVRNIGRAGARGHRDLRRRRRALGPEGASCSACRWRAARPLRATRCRSTAAAASPPTTTSDCASSSRGWVERDGCRWVKMKIGSRARARPAPRRVARKRAIGDARLFVDANGALRRASRRWRSPSGLAATRRRAGSRSRSRPTISRACACVRERAAGGDGDRRRRIWLRPRLLPPHAGSRARSMCSRRTSRAAAASPASCRSAALCEAHHIDLSGHCAPALHLHAACAAPRLRHLEWFHDHVRIEHMLFDGAPVAARRRDRGRICRGPARARLQAPGCGALCRSHDRRPLARAGPALG